METQDDTSSTHSESEETPAPQIPDPPITLASVETLGTAMGTTIKESLPSMPASQPTPVKHKRLPDPLDPEPKEGIARFLLHQDITTACQLVMANVKKALMSG